MTPAESRGAAPPPSAVPIESGACAAVLLPSAAPAPVDAMRARERKVPDDEVAADALVRVTQEDVRRSQSAAVSEDEVAMGECETLVRECCRLHPAHRAADRMAMAVFRILEPALTQSHRIDSLRRVVARLQHVLDGSPSVDKDDQDDDDGSTATADGDSDGDDDDDGSDDRLDADRRGVRRGRRADPLRPPPLPAPVDAKLARHVVRLFRRRGLLLHRVFVRAVRIRSVLATASSEDADHHVAQASARRSSMGDDDDAAGHDRSRGSSSFGQPLNAAHAARRRYQPQATIEHDDTRPLFVVVVTRAKIRVAITCAIVLLAAVLFGMTLS